MKSDQKPDTSDRGQATAEPYTEALKKSSGKITV
jgi:hypothetical protein